MTKTTKQLLAALVLAGLATSAGWAQTSSAKAQTSGAKTKAAASAKKAQVDAKSKAEQTAAGIEAAEAALTPAELAIAERVYVGKVPCELGVFVTLAADPKMPGYFDVTVKNQKFRMFPVVSATGATRLEDQRNGAMWLQLGNKSMLMSQKQGIRLADACVTPAQAVVQAAMDKAPPVNLLEARPRALPASAALATTVVTTTTTTTTATYALPPALPASAAMAAVAAANAANASVASGTAPPPALAASATTTTTTTTTTFAVPTAAPASAAGAPR